ncbi:MAG: hypothetical protein OEV49_09560 [candidate division Zixibacteria bacterium]|nr:hypothetical protein [candidate division Zixibacteria bacterium]MDH3938161.1 hypothetical protein [candidate division Zixibacteria bacterium]MDH4033536.1 hypothetical protein [candidate division Zixibacteria bacterium]
MCRQILYLLICGMVSTATARTVSDTPSGRHLPRSLALAAPAHQLAAHRIGKISLAVANNGTFGREYLPGPSIDWYTGEEIGFSCEYPKGSRVNYLFGGAFWIGAVVGRDTLVSVGADGWQQLYEMFPDQAPFGRMKHRSIKDPSRPDFEGAVSEEDFVAVYTDTFTDGIQNDYFGRVHRPLNIEVTQSSYAWSYAYAEDFVLFDYQIQNIGTRTLRDVYMGIYDDCMICFDCFGLLPGFTDDHSGFLHTYPNQYGSCVFEDTVNIAWQADDDGDLDLIYSDGGKHPTDDVVAMRIVRTPAEELDVSFNWWIGNGNAALDFGPREKGNVGRLDEPFRDFGTGGLGTPEGDVNKYYVMRNREFDYNQVFTAAIQTNDTLWLHPNPEQAADFADGFDTRYLLSFGPFEIRPGQTLPISFAYLAGENLHRDVGNRENLPDRPDLYIQNLDFSDLALNAMWASWIYDNPGVDTDGDGFSGKIRICCEDSTIRLDTVNEDPIQVDTTWSFTACDTIFYEGDGVPDFRGAAPPPAPEFWVDTRPGALTVHFNGLRSETSRDAFSRELDFEGYRIYLGRDERAPSYQIIASFDIEDYNKFFYDRTVRPRAAYRLMDTPFSLDELRCLYADSCGDTLFDPMAYTRSRPYVHPEFSDSVFYFEPQDYNVSRLGVDTPIRKLFPMQPPPSSLNPDSAQSDELTAAGRLKYFEYVFEIENLLPTASYWINVTAFDYGSPLSGLASLETSVTVGAVEVYAQSSWNDIQSENLKAYVYPNPYLLDGDYRGRGYEGRVESDHPHDRTRTIHFANVPPICTIRVFTIDGDLVREIAHNDGTTHEEWNLITRNTQMVVSGLYYWTVESADGAVQMGKLAIIM